MDRTPTLGRIVHYVLPADSANAGQHRAALVTEPLPDMAPNLLVYGNSVGDYLADHFTPAWNVRSVSYDADGREAGSWHWPEREPDSDPVITGTGAQANTIAELPPRPLTTVAVPENVAVDAPKDEAVNADQS